MYLELLRKPKTKGQRDKVMADKLKPDILLKEYWNRNAEFADLFNAFLYGGKPVIKAEELEERDTENSIVLQAGAAEETVQAARDLFKVVMAAGNVQYVLLGIENQESIHYAMPLRDLEYFTFGYIKQYERIKAKYPDRKGLSGNEFLSYMKKTDKFKPIITVVIYYGEEEWDAAKSLHEMMDIPEELEPFVNDYKMNLIEARNTKLVFHNKNNQAFFHAFRVMFDKNKTIQEKKKEIIEYAKRNQTDGAVLRAVASASGRTLKISGKEDIDMNTFFKELTKESEERGIKIGEAKGRAEGNLEGEVKGVIKMSRQLKMTDSDIIRMIQTTMQVTAEKSREYYERYNEKV